LTDEPRTDESDPQPCTVFRVQATTYAHWNVLSGGRR
jgi:hypothetical protein